MIHRLFGPPFDVSGSEEVVWPTSTTTGASWSPEDAVATWAQPLRLDSPDTALRWVRKLGRWVGGEAACRLHGRSEDGRPSRDAPLDLGLGGGVFDLGREGRRWSSSRTEPQTTLEVCSWAFSVLFSWILLWLQWMVDGDCLLLCL